MFAPRQPRRSAAREADGTSASRKVHEDLPVEAPAGSPARGTRRLQDIPLHRPDRPAPAWHGIPESVRQPLEESFRADFSAVEARESPQALDLGARAFTRGDEIVFAPGQWRPYSRAGREVLAHELTHVVQQRQDRVRPTGERAGVPLNERAHLEREAARSAGDVLARRPLRQRGEAIPATSPHRALPAQLVPFVGPQFDVATAGFANPNYPGHDFDNVAAANAHTACGTQNRITTAGERLNKAASNAGTPTNMATYRDGFDRPGGLVRDRTRNQAATKLHLINHRFQNDGETQNNPNNIMLGTQKANNPTHLHEVENPVINALRTHARRQNATYENEIAAAVKTTDAATKADQYLFWPQGAEPTEITTDGEFELIAGAAAQGVAPAPPPPPSGSTKKAKSSNVRGEALKVDANVAALQKAQLWLKYTVTANYPPGVGARLQYLKDNITHEQNANTAGANDAAINQKILDFGNFWIDNAHPVDFRCQVTYYWASYDPWQGIYRTESEDHTIPSDAA